MPHMRGGPDTWHVSQTRRRVESSVLSQFKPDDLSQRVRRHTDRHLRHSLCGACVLC